MNKDYLSQTELDKLKLFVQDDVLLEAVKKVLLAGVYDQGILKPSEPAKAKLNFALAIANNTWDNEKIGEELRAAYKGVTFVELGFDELLALKENADAEKAEVNPAL